ncbi:hypothetical protein IC582_001892 [Cucumis melo]
MEDSSEDEREMLPKVRKKSFVPRGPTTMSELALLRNFGQKLLIQFNEHGQPVGATSKKMQSYIGVCVQQQIPITCNSWKEVPNELKDKIYDCISDELVATNKNEDILTDALGSKEHGGRVRGVGGFVSQSQYFNTVKGKEKMCHKEEDDLRCKSDKKRSNHSRSSIGSINIDLDADEDTPTNKGVEVIDFVKYSTRKDVVYSSNYTDVNGIIKLLNRHAVNNMKNVDMIHIPMNELIFGSDKFVYLAREDLLHYCGMVEIGYMCILAYITFHWMLHVIDLRENCVYVLDSLRSKVNEDIHGIINVGLKTWQVKHDLQRYRSTPKWRPVKCPRQLDSVGCGYYVQKCWMIVFVVVLYGSVEKCARILVLDLMHCRCLLLVCHGWQDVLFDMCDYIYKWIYWRIWSSWTYSLLNIVFYMEVYAGILGIIVCIAGELVIRH